MKSAEYIDYRWAWNAIYETYPPAWHTNIHKFGTYVILKNYIGISRAEYSLKKDQI